MQAGLGDGGSSKARRGCLFFGPPPAGEMEDARFRAEDDPPALSPAANTRAHVGNVQRQHVADGDEREGVVGVVAGEPRVDLGDEFAGSTVVRDRVALERVERVLEHRDGEALLRPQRATRPDREAVHALVGVIGHAAERSIGATEAEYGFVRT